MRRLAWLLLAGILLTAGCLGLGSDDAEEAPDAGEEAEPGSTNETTQTGTSPTSAEGGADEGAERAERTLEAPPELVDGEWWTVSIESAFTGLNTEATIVKAGGHGDAYMVGMPDAEFVDDAVLLHLPPQGSVDAATLGYPVHNNVFQPLTFPLEPGASWETHWTDQPVEAEVVEVDEEAATAHVEMIGDNAFVEVHYEAELGMPRSIQIDGYGGYEVVDHGYGYDGDLHVPWEPEILFLNGRIAGAVDTQLTPAPPMEEIEVTGEHDEAVVALLLGNALTEDAPGYYEASAEAPDGTVHEASFVATPGDAFQLVSTRVDEPVGTWQMEYVAGGAGIAAAEGIGYDAMHVVLEDGEMQGMMEMG